MNTSVKTVSPDSEYEVYANGDLIGSCGTKERADRLLSIVDTLALVFRGLEDGSIKSKPIVTGMDDPEATEYGIKSLREIIEEALPMARNGKGK